MLGCCRSVGKGQLRLPGHVRNGQKAAPAELGRHGGGGAEHRWGGRLGGASCAELDVTEGESEQGTLRYWIQETGKGQSQRGRWGLDNEALMASRGNVTSRLHCCPTGQATHVKRTVEG